MRYWISRRLSEQFLEDPDKTQHVVKEQMYKKVQSYQSKRKEFSFPLDSRLVGISSREVDQQ